MNDITFSSLLYVLLTLSHSYSFLLSGIGPKACLNFDSLDIGDIFINSLHRYEVTITNMGDVPAEWKLVAPSTPFAPMFAFSPMKGNLPVGEDQTLVVEFKSGNLGDFCEIFEFAMKGKKRRKEKDRHEERTKASKNE
jgi:hypothetical protein